MFNVIETHFSEYWESIRGDLCTVSVLDKSISGVLKREL